MTSTVFIICSIAWVWMGWLAGRRAGEKAERAKWRKVLHIPNDGRTYQITSISYEVVKEKKA